jgi:hypothetical protein
MKKIVTDVGLIAYLKTKGFKYSTSRNEKGIIVYTFDLKNDENIADEYWSSDFITFKENIKKTQNEIKFKKNN